MLTKADKINIAKFQVKELKRQLQNAIISLQQAEEDWCKLNSCDGDRQSVKKPPILSCCDARVSCEMAMEFIGDMERMLKS